MSRVTQTVSSSSAGGSSASSASSSSEKKERARNRKDKQTSASSQQQPQQTCSSSQSQSQQQSAEPKSKNSYWYRNNFERSATARFNPQASGASPCNRPDQHNQRYIRSSNSTFTSHKSSSNSKSSDSASVTTSNFAELQSLYSLNFPPLRSTHSSSTTSSGSTNQKQTSVTVHTSASATNSWASGSLATSTSASLSLSAAASASESGVTGNNTPTPTHSNSRSPRNCTCRPEPTRRSFAASAAASTDSVHRLDRDVQQTRVTTSSDISICSDSSESVAQRRAQRESSFRRSLPAGLVVSNIAPCFARLKQIVSSVRRSRSSSARMSVSGTKRKSSPPSFSSRDESSNGAGTSSSSSSVEDHDDSPVNPNKMRRRQSSQPSTHNVAASTFCSTSLASVLSKYFADSTPYAYASNATPGANNLYQHLSQSQSKSKSTELCSNNVVYSRLRKNRVKDTSVVSAIPLCDIQRKEFELPYKLRVQLDQAPICREEQLKHSWNDQDKSLNIVILPHTNSLIFRRYPVAQSTDCIRGKMGYSSGLHIWEIKWPANQRGTHAVIGVATKDAPLHCSGYKSLIGSNGESWGWDIGRSKLMHDYTNNQPKTYPSYLLEKEEVIVVPEKVSVILDMDEGTLAYMVDGQYLGVAFRGLKALNKPLYPIVSAVWGHCEVEMTYLHAPQGSSFHSYLSNWLWLVCYQPTCTCTWSTS